MNLLRRPTAGSGFITQAELNPIDVPSSGTRAVRSTGSIPCEFLYVPLFGRDVFTFDAERDQYCCPLGHPLPLARSKRTEGVGVYRADAVLCSACPVKAKCTTKCAQPG